MTPGSAPLWIIDTNVLVSAALTAGGTCDRLLRYAVDGRLRLGWSAPILAEYRAVLSRPRFSFSPGVVSALLLMFAPGDQVTPGAAPVLPDREDEMFLAAALAAPDKVLVTGNRAHFPTAICHPVRILSPAEALAHLAGG